MGITNIGKRYIALNIGGSQVPFPTYTIIGTGSGTFSAGQTALINATDRQPVTSTDLTTLQKVVWTTDWTSVEMSGTSLTEFGMIGSGTGLTGSIYSRVGLPAIVFDGTNELRVQETWEVF